MAIPLVLLLAWLLPTVFAASLTQVSNFGDNPGSLQMYIYVPNNLASKPAIIVAMHPCGGSATQYYGMYDYHTPADQYGYILIYPSATRDLNCFDADTAASLTHNGGSDSLSIVNMVKYTISKYGADSSKVYMTGSSSGAIMTNVLAGTYPDVFAAGAAFSGMPFACLSGAGGADPAMSNQTCSRGQINHTPQEWAAYVHNAYPGYTGQYPRLQVWHGTADNVISYTDFNQEISQWTTVMGLSFTSNQTNTPLSGYTKMIYGDGSRFQAFSASGVGHFVPTDVSVVLDWFGITGGGGGNGGGSGSTTTTTSATTTSTGPTGGCTAAHWDQCGGNGYTGCTSCASPYTCQKVNDYYSQCL
ncbi:feruloyl esterase B precursor, putative [Talaromyces stipitatus ATCC 10500]|uniref:Feruloyl esterase B n=1 Tax=Talaromyces stipitatus (strain ATCC 10500 / CBS 375.48 / QM 6759 / NRRL 1006) TaxID=441959 RepID=FAEB_TALSN|nr:feruloyl esterase B precursor, putative [Talaromyces stipitatus ATCC 10500]B8M9H9.1 RecName: Full=Feruloyl esterase B; AltName: Full=Ferulic acid esterase B; Short=FAE; Flags: Precursor [Talaromyces stipitatus ATCC 10500]EED17739.1 feruloyl esterase B precursor, putative [Talaromyces stipitatus ATCC 10500]